MTRPQLNRRKGEFSAIGRTLDRYAIVSVLGEGHTHDVYGVEDRSTGFSFALKLPRTPWEQASIDAAARDYAILRAIDDPHLVRIHDVSTRFDMPYAVFELIDADRVSDAAPLDWRRALAIVKQMCAPLHAAAERGFFSRKLSPDHVFLQSRAPTVSGGDPYRGVVESSDHVKVALGTNVGANPPRVDKAFHGYAGSLDCTSPELLGGVPGDERSYVFTLGVFAHFLITGRWPFGEASLVTRCIPPTTPVAPVSALVPDVPRPIDTLILTCLAHDPKRRYPTTLVLRDVLATFG